MILKCNYCGKEYKTYSANRCKNNYCSKECAQKARIEFRTKEIACDYCGKMFERKLNNEFYSHKNHFCSTICANEFQCRNKLKFICKTCGKEFYRSKSWIKQKRGYYCSLDCRNKDPEWAIKSHIIANVIQCKKKGLNKLELAGNEILDSLGVDYLTQYLINNKICVDVYIPQYNLIIQWDGNYWHGKDIKYEDLDKRQKKRVDLDKSQDAYFKKCGFNELRFWESDVLKRKETVYENIKRAISEIA